MDLAKPELRALIDLRNKPQFVQPLSRALEPVHAAPDGTNEATTTSVMHPVERPEGRIAAH
jgi:hypothetical protein